MKQRNSKSSKSSSNREHSILFGMLKSKNIDGKWRFRPQYKRISIVAITAFIALWLAASFTIFLAYKYVKKYEDVSFFDIAKAPLSMSEHRIKMGEFNIKKSEQLFKEKDFVNGFSHLRNGVLRSPDNLEARLNLAKIYAFSIKDPKTASDFLDLKIKKAFEEKNKSYVLSSIMIFFLSNEHLDKAAALTTGVVNSKLLSEKEIINLFKTTFTLPIEYRNKRIADFSVKIIDNLPQSEFKKFIAYNSAICLSSMGQNIEALDMLKKAQVESGNIYDQILARKLWDESNEVEALKKLMGIIKKGKAHNISQVYSLLAKFYSDAGLEKEAQEQKKLAAMTAGNLYAIRIWEICNIKDIKEAIEQVQDFQKAFENDKAAIFNLAQTALHNKKFEIVEQAAKNADIKNPQDIPLRLLKLEALINMNKLKDATEEINSIKYQLKEKNFDEAIEGFSMAIWVLTGNEINKQMKDFTSKYSDSDIKLNALAKLLHRSNLNAGAKDLLYMTLELFPDNNESIELLSEILFSEKDYAGFLRIVGTTKSRIPLRLLASFNEEYSDRCTFVDPNIKKIAIQKIKDAKEKVKVFQSL